MGKTGVLGRGGILRAAEVVDLAAAATLLAVESGGDRNGGQRRCVDRRIYAKGSEVTQAA